MGDDFDGGDTDSVDTSSDISDSSSEVGDTSDDLSSDIPEDVSDSAGDDISDDGSTDVAEDIAEDVSEEPSIDTHEDIPETVAEDAPEDTSSDTAQGSNEAQKEKEPLTEQIEKEATLRDDIKDNPEFIDENGDLKWPELDGFASEPEKVTSPTGEQVDRFGSEDSAFVAPMETPYEERSLPFDKASQEYHAYEFVKPLDGVLKGETSPAFNQPGGGMQEKLPESVGDLVEKGILKRI